MGLLSVLFKGTARWSDSRDGITSSSARKPSGSYTGPRVFEIDNGSSISVIEYNDRGEHVSTTFRKR